MINNITKLVWNLYEARGFDARNIIAWDVVESLTEPGQKRLIVQRQNDVIMLPISTRVAFELLHDNFT